MIYFNKILMHCLCGPRFGSCCVSMLTNLCKTTHFGWNNQNYQYTMNFEHLDSVEEVKDIWVIYQQVLKFSKRITTKVNKANSMLSLIFRTFQFIEQDSFILMYKAMVLKFSNRITTKVNKANSMISLIVRTFQFIEQDSFILMYKAMVRPHMEYGNTIWYSHLRRDIESVERIQKWVTEFITMLWPFNTCKKCVSACY